MKNIDKQLVAKAVLMVSTITIIVSFLVAFSYHILGPVPTISLVGIYAALGFWLHFELNRKFVSKEKEDVSVNPNVSTPINNLDDEMIQDAWYEIVEIHDPKMDKI